MVRRHDDDDDDDDGSETGARISFLLLHKSQYYEQKPANKRRSELSLFFFCQLQLCLRATEIIYSDYAAIIDGLMDIKRVCWD